MDQWDACGDAIDAASLIGRPCIAGLDLSTVNDLAALCLVFPQDDPENQYIVLPYFWCPADNAHERERRDRAPYVSWARDGFITLTPGNSIDYRAIRATVKDLGKRYQIQEIAFDPYNATHLATELGEEDGFSMVQFRQGMLSMNEPTKFMLRLLLDGKLRHGGNPVLRWMASNVSGITDAAGNVKPDKKSSAEKIDGIVALIMGLGRAMVTRKYASVYDAPGRELIVI
jgi:phage terminase large subunit-like protein